MVQAMLQSGAKYGRHLKKKSTRLISRSVGQGGCPPYYFDPAHSDPQLASSGICFGGCGGRVCANTRKEVSKMVEIDVLNPVAVTKAESDDVELAPRLAELKGKTIGLFFNQKAGGDVLLEETAQLLQQRYDGITFKNYLGAVGHIMRHATPEQADEITKECDAVIASTAD